MWQIVVDVVDLIGMQSPVIRGHFLVARFLDAHHKLVAIQKAKIEFVCVVRAKDRRQIAGDGAPPSADVFLPDRFAEVALDKVLQKH